MAHEVEFDVRVNKEGDREEVILKETGGAATIAFYPEGDKQGYFKTGKARGVFTMQEVIPESPAEPASKSKK